MNFLFELDESRLAEQLPPLLDAFEADIKKAEPLFETNGQRLEMLARTVPQHQAYYALRAQEAKQLMKWLENHLAKIEARMTKNMLSGSNRAFGQRETTALIAGEKEVVEQKQLVIAASLAWQQLDSIVEAFQQMGWMVGHITKLRVAELQDVIL